MRDVDETLDAKRNMTMRRLAAGLAVIAAALVATPFARGGDWLWVLAAAALALLWAASPQESDNWVASVGMCGLTGLAAVAVFRHDALAWSAPAVIMALAAWDLSDVAGRFAASAAVRQPIALIRGHVTQLVLVLGSAWLLGALAMQLPIRINFLWALVLVLLMVVSLSQVIRAARRTEAIVDADVSEIASASTAGRN